MQHRIGRRVKSCVTAAGPTRQASAVLQPLELLLTGDEANDAVDTCGVATAPEWWPAPSRGHVVFGEVEPEEAEELSMITTSSSLANGEDMASI